MSTPLRLIIAIVFAMIAGLIMMPFSNTSIGGMVMNVAVGFGIGGLTFFLVLVLTPSKKELQQNFDAVEVVERHANGERKLTGLVIHGKKERDWRYYDEQGKHFKTEIYNDGHLMRTIEGDDL